MNRDAIENKLREILTTDFRVAPEKIASEATFRGTLGMDSLDAVDFIYLVTKAFGLKQDLAAFRELHTVGKVVDYLAEEVAAKEKAP
jgi:acyl carrier protein